AMLKDELFERYLPISDRDCNAVGDQLTRELQDFVHCVQKGTGPRVTAEDGRDAVALASEILESISSHQWEGHAKGPIGPSQLPLPRGTFFRPAHRNAAA